VPRVRFDLLQQRDLQFCAMLGGDRRKVEQARVCEAERLGDREWFVDEARVRSD
jgi:hypothetical protein